MPATTTIMKALAVPKNKPLLSYTMHLGEDAEKGAGDGALFFSRLYRGQTRSFPERSVLVVRYKQKRKAVEVAAKPSHKSGRPVFRRSIGVDGPLAQLFIPSSLFSLLSLRPLRETLLR